MIIVHIYLNPFQRAFCSHDVKLKCYSNQQMPNRDLIKGVIISDVLAITELNINEGTQNELAVLIREFQSFCAWEKEVAAHTACGVIDGVAKIMNKFRYRRSFYIIYPTFDCTLKQYALNLNHHIRRQSRTSRIDIMKQLVDLIADIHHVGYVLRVYGISSFALTEVAGINGGHRIRVYSLLCAREGEDLMPSTGVMCTVDKYSNLGTDAYEPLWAPPESTENNEYGHKSDVFIVGKLSMFLLFQKLIPIATISDSGNWIGTDQSGFLMQFLQMTLGNYNERPSANTLQKHYYSLQLTKFKISSMTSAIISVTVDLETHLSIG